jgi:hypothetical protein
VELSDLIYGKTGLVEKEKREEMSANQICFTFGEFKI